ncbi:hypothetical protein GJ496_010643 [Pomphorhynchus laevis]|nr:hypothetical protein GJ496_010643 [Pomphorhynchus laevis]
MKVYKDIVSGDELFSDSYPSELKDGMYYEVQGEFISSSLDIDDKLIGGNKSAEDPADEGLDSTTVTGINVVLAQNLQETSYTKAQYKVWLKNYCKKLEEHLLKKNPERVSEFKKSMQTLAVRILKDFDDFQFYTGESMDPDGMVILTYYSKEDQTNPRFMFIKDGVEEVKY